MTAVLNDRPDVLVIGATPAGYAAATAAAAAKARTVLIGGPVPEILSVPDEDRQRADDAGVQILETRRVWGGFKTLEIATVQDAHQFTFRPQRLIIAIEPEPRVWPVSGWRLPGVFHGHLPADVDRARALTVCGYGGAALRQAVDLVTAGLKINLVSEIQSEADLANFATEIAALRAAAVPILFAHEVHALGGEDTVREVALRCQTSGALTAKATDYALLCHGVVPSTELPRMLGCDHVADKRTLSLETVRDDDGRTSLSTVLVVAPAGGAAAKVEGCLAGILAAADILPFDAQLEGILADARRTLEGTRGTDNVPASLPPSYLAEDSAILCSCENVTFGRIRRLIAERNHSPAVLKKLTRLGMGICRGRDCTRAFLDLLLEADITLTEFDFLAPRAPLSPVPISGLAAEQPEWRGFESFTPPAIVNRGDASKATLLPPTKFDFAIIGGGVIGSACARELSQAGASVAVIEVGDINSQSSGANAGSLHIQITSKDFVDGAPLGRVAQSLDLSHRSIALWHEIAAETDAPIGLKITGGIMVAENEERLRYLEQKVAVERSFGVQSQLLTGAALRRVAPYLSPTVAGAEFCPGEGKIDPLQATHAIARLASQAGAQFYTSTRLEGIRLDGDTFALSTSVGRLQARQVINAAGAWSDSVSRMVGLTSPIVGASIQVLVSEPMPQFIGHLVYHAGRHLTAKQSHGGQVIMGGAWPGDYDAGENLFTNRLRSIQGNLFAAASIIPRIGEVRLLRSWAAMNVIADGAPVVGPSPKMPGFHQVASGNGYTLAPILARLTADLALGRKPVVDPRAFSIERFA